MSALRLIWRKFDSLEVGHFRKVIRLLCVRLKERELNGLRFRQESWHGICLSLQGVAPRELEDERPMIMKFISIKEIKIWQR